MEFLIPGVKHTERADLGAEMFGISGNFHQGFGTTAEQETVDNGLILQGQWGQLVGHGEDDVGIRCGEEFGTARGQPAIARLPLTLWAVPVATGVERDGLMAAAGTLIQMASQGGGPASEDSQQHFLV